MTQQSKQGLLHLRGLDSNKMVIDALPECRSQLCCPNCSEAMRAYYYKMSKPSGAADTNTRVAEI